MADTFFTQPACDRCKTKLDIRTQSWFTTDTICMSCSEKEDEIKRKLRLEGCTSALEGCGYVPVVMRLDQGRY